MSETKTGWVTGVPVFPCWTWTLKSGVEYSQTYRNDVVLWSGVSVVCFMKPPTLSEIRTAMEPEVTDESKYLLIPKLLKDHPQPPPDGNRYIGWRLNGLPYVFTNESRWIDVLAWAGPVEPLGRAYEFETWAKANDIDWTNPATRKAFYAGKEAK